LSAVGLFSAPIDENLQQYSVRKRAYSNPDQSRCLDQQSRASPNIGERFSDCDTEKSMPKEKSYHYYLICGTLMCVNDEGNISGVSLNAILPNEIKEIDVQAIAKAQQSLQMNFEQRMQGEQINVVDVVIASISYLGFMTQSKFTREPTGMQLQERVMTDPNDPFSTDLSVTSALPTLENAPT
jgi:hypothetical protein